MGEARRKQKKAVARRDGNADEAMVVDTLGGRMHVRWDGGWSVQARHSMAGVASSEG